MAKAMTNLPRRAILAGAIGTTAVAALPADALAASNPDAEVLRLYARWQELETERNQAVSDEDEIEAEARRHYPPQPELPDELRADQAESAQAEYEAACRAIDERFGVTAHETAQEARMTEQQDIATRIARLPAYTPAGVAAKVFIGGVYAGAIIDPDPEEDGTAMLLVSALRDLQRMAGSVS